MNKAQRGAMRKGYQAYEQHQPKSACPYHDTRCGRHNHIVTYARGFIAAWHTGYEIARENQQAGDYRGWFADRANHTATQRHGPDV